MRENGALSVRVRRDLAMRTQGGGAASEGGAATKNTILVGSRCRTPRRDGFERDGFAPVDCAEHTGSRDGPEAERSVIW